MLEVPDDSGPSNRLKVIAEELEALVLPEAPESPEELDFMTCAEPLSPLGIFDHLMPFALSFDFFEQLGQM